MKALLIYFQPVYLQPSMSRFSSILLIFIAFALLGQTAVASFAPDLTKFTSSAVANPSGWSEEAAEEDEAGEDDKVVSGTPIWNGHVASLPVSQNHSASELRDLSPEIFVPPPQG